MKQRTRKTRVTRKPYRGNPWKCIDSVLLPQLRLLGFGKRLRKYPKDLTLIALINQWLLKRRTANKFYVEVAPSGSTNWDTLKANGFSFQITGYDKESNNWGREYSGETYETVDIAVMY